MNIKHRAVVWFGDLERFAEGIYGKNPNILDTNEFHNGSYIKTYEINKDTDYSEPWEDAEQAIVDWLEGDSSFIMTDYLLWDLIRKGHLSADDYLIEVWW